MAAAAATAAAVVVTVAAASVVTAAAAAEAMTAAAVAAVAVAVAGWTVVVRTICRGPPEAPTYPGVAPLPTAVAAAMAKSSPPPPQAIPYERLSRVLPRNIAGVRSAARREQDLAAVVCEIAVSVEVEASFRFGVRLESPYDMVEARLPREHVAVSDVAWQRSR